MWLYRKDVNKYRAFFDCGADDYIPPPDHILFDTAEEAAARCHYLNGGNAEALEHIGRALESIAADMREIRQIMQAKARGET